MKLKNILEVSICAFGQTIFDMQSLEDEEFVRALNSYLNDDDYKDMLEEYSYEFEYDIVDIKNKCNSISIKNKEFEYLDIMNCCRVAFIKTIVEDKTINPEALIDNIVNEFKKINK